MKITVYELLRLIKDGKAPKKIKVYDFIWIWAGDDYKRLDAEKYLITGVEYMWVTEFLKEEVEIIEDKPKHIEEIPKEEIEYSMSIGEQMCAKKINELSKAVNYLLDKEGK